MANKMSNEEQTQWILAVRQSQIGDHGANEGKFLKNGKSCNGQFPLKKRLAYCFM